MATIITGTTQGLGSKLAPLLLEKDAGAIVVNRRRSGQANELIYDLASKPAVDTLKSELVGRTTDDKVLFVLNAAVYGDDETVSDITPESAGNILYTNVFSQLALVEALLQADKSVRLAAVSSSMGSIGTAPEPYHYAYGSSKAALNLGIRLMSKQYNNLSYLIIDPGWMQTQMGGEGATEDPATVARLFMNAIFEGSHWNNASGMLDITTGNTIIW